MYDIYIFYTAKLSTSDIEYLKAAMKFKPKFDGKLRKEGDLKPLIHRNKMVSWYNRVCTIKGFNEHHAVLVLTDSLTDRAEETFYKNNNNIGNDIIEFLSWFDKTYNMINLRTSTYEIIDKWFIKKTTPRIKIIDEFKYFLSLYDQSGDMATQTLKEFTAFTEEQLVNKITCQLQAYDSLLWDEFSTQTSFNCGLPKNLDELQDVLIDCDKMLREREIMRTGNYNVNSRNNNNNKYDKYDNDNITDIGSVNITRFNNNYNNYRGGRNTRGSRNNYNNNRGYYNNRGNRYYNNNNNYRGNNNNNRGRGGYNNRGYRGNNYRGNGYRNNNNYRGNNNNNYRGRYNNNNNNYNNFNNRGNSFMPSGNPAFFRPIQYATLRCRNPKCNKWGHRAYYCHFMNTYFPEVTNSYDKLFNNNNNNNNNSVSTIQQNNNNENNLNNINNNNNNNNNNNLNNNNNNSNSNSNINNNNNGNNPSNYGVYPGFQ